jgi:hypothetical protein
VTSGHPDHQRLLANALNWALAGSPPLVTLEAPSAEDAAEIHVTLLRQRTAGHLYAHLVNYTGTRGRPVRAPHRVGPITLTLATPGVAGSQGADLLVSGHSVDAHADRGRLSVTVPDLNLYEVVRVAG